MCLGDPPNDWKEVSVNDFENFLTSCADYTRTAWSNGAVYEFRHNGQRFA